MRIRNAVTVRATSVVAFSMFSMLASSAIAENVNVPITYSYQRFNNWCGSASVQMILSSPAIKDNNRFVKDMLSAPDAPGVPANGVRQQPTYGIVNGDSNATANPQAAIYNLTHGLANVNGRSYLNPFVPYGSGSDTLGMATALNLLDNRNFPNAVPLGNHSFTAWNFAPSAAGAALATKQIANSIKATNVAAQAGIGGGTHSIVVNGITTDAAIAPNTNYNVTGVFVSDPWSGFVDQQIAAGFGNPGGANGPRGFGFNAWVPHGYDIIPTSLNIINVPGVGLVRGRYKKWLQSFNVSPATPGAGPVFATPGVQFITASSSGVAGNVVNNIPLETGGPNGNFFGLIGTPVLAQPINNRAAARQRAVAALAGNNALAVLPNFVGGGFDLDDADIAFVPDLEVGLADAGDWIVPYLQTGDTDYSGALVIDSLTGEIDLSIFSSSDTDDYSLSELTNIYSAINSNIYPDSGLFVPEPGSMAGLFVLGAVTLRRRR